MKKRFRYDELSEERCAVCPRRLKLNVTSRKTTRPLTCYGCDEPRRERQRRGAPS